MSLLRLTLPVFLLSVSFSLAVAQSTDDLNFDDLFVLNL